MKKRNLKKYLNKKIILFILIITIIILSIILMIIKNTEKEYKDTVTYKGETYIYLEYNQDIFTYNLNNYNNDYFEEDVIKPITHDKWNIVYLNGDLFVTEKEVEKATEYYKNDKNYEWFIVTEKNDVESIVPISLTEEEKEYIYDMDNMKKSATTTFEEIEQFADLTKISKDKTIYAVICLAYTKDHWYWKTEIMSDTGENQEYIIKLPESLNKKINNALNNNG